MSQNALVLYYQITMGAAHVARVRALDAQPGISARGIQLAETERTRRFRPTPEEAEWFDTLHSGAYEDAGRLQLVAQARAQLIELAPKMIILDQASDVIQMGIGIAARRLGIKTCFRWATTLDDYQRSAFRERLKGFIYRGWDAYLAAGERAAAYLESVGIPESDIFLCGNPSDHRRTERVLAESPSVDRNNRFLFVGRFIPHKNLPRLLDAYRQYRQEGGQFGLDLAGYAVEEHELIRRSKDIPDIQFLGHQDYRELIDLYRSCAALVLPSISENWGLVVNEAMHTGAPILLSEPCGCIPELLDEGQNGFSFAPLDVAAIAKALHRFERLSPRERHGMETRSLEVIAGHSVDAWAERVAGVCLSPSANP